MNVMIRQRHVWDILYSYMGGVFFYQRLMGHRDPLVFLLYFIFGGYFLALVLSSPGRFTLAFVQSFFFYFISFHFYFSGCFLLPQTLHSRGTTKRRCITIESSGSGFAVSGRAFFWHFYTFLFDFFWFMCFFLYYVLRYTTNASFFIQGMGS